MTDKPDGIFYMRDNHTFTKLSDDVETALKQIEEDFDEGWTCGMLCSKRPGWTHIHANGKAERESFLKQVRTRLEELK